MEGDDQNDPIVDGARSLLDGHIVLDRSLAAKGHYPPISILDSLSRLMPAVASREQMDKARALRALMAAYAESEDLINVGAYQKGSDPMLDRAIAAMPALRRFLQQSPTERTSLEQVVAELVKLPV